MIQHKLYTRLLSGRLIFPPVHFTDNQEVLDIGTGAGDQFSSVLRAVIRSPL